MATERIYLYALKSIYGDLEITQDEIMFILKECVNFGIDISKHSFYIFLSAIMHNHMEIINFLIEHRIDIRQNNDEALRTACEYANIELIKLLLNMGADAISQNGKCFDQIRLYGNETVNENTIIDIIKLLIEFGGDPFANDNYFFNKICINYNHSNVIKYLISIGGTGAKLTVGMPIKIMKLLFENGSNPNIGLAPTQKQRTQLLEHYIYHMRLDYCKLLLDYNADINLCKNLVNKNYKFFVGGRVWDTEGINLMKQIVELFAEFGHDISAILEKIELS